MTEAEFKKFDKEHPGYVLCCPGTDLGRDNHLKVEIDPYNVETIKPFLDIDSEEERDNRIKHLFVYLNTEYDELAVERVCNYLKQKFGFKQKTLDAIQKRIRPEPEKKLEITEGLFQVANYLTNVISFYDRKPFFYDKNDLFWFWNNEEHKYEIVDTVDLMNEIEDTLGMFGQTVNGNVKSAYIEAFKRVGRKNHPKPAPGKWIQFKDKAFSLKTGKIYKVQPNYFFTNPIPWEMGESSETLMMDKLFKDWVGEKYVDTLYEIIAYCTYTDYPIHRIFALVGSGCNGKSKYQQLLRTFIGAENTTATELDVLLDSRFESAKLYKKLACIMGETNFGVMNKTSLLKKLSGQDLIGYEFKQKKPFEDINYAKLIINSNSMPSSEDTSKGFFRRWLTLEFNNEFEEGKDILKSIPEIEYNNLAKKVTEILPKLLERGSFTNEGTQEERKQKYILASNPLSLFIEHFFHESPLGFVRYSEFYKDYVIFLKKLNKRIVSKREFTKALEFEGLEIRKTTKKIDDVFINDRYVEGIEKNYDFCDFMLKFSLNFLYREMSSKKTNKVTKVTKENTQDVVVEEKTTQYVVEKVE